MDDLPIIELRRIEANVIKPIYEEMVQSLGKAKAREILGNAIRKNAIEHGRRLAEKEPPGGNDLAGFARLLPNWQKQDALRIDVLESSERRFDFNVVRCRYAEMYREMGIGEIGDLLSCGRDGAFCAGYNADIEFRRTQTIMGGANHCDFRYKLPDGE
jgi:hypothetical protein